MSCAAPEKIPAEPRAAWLLDDPEIDRELREARTWALRWRQRAEQTSGQPPAGCDAPEISPADRTAAPKRTVAGDGLGPWLVGLGAAGFICGGLLIGWSFWAERPELWHVGLPLGIAGQAGLLLGMILQIEALSQANATTAEEMDALDGRVEAQAERSGVAARDFYHHWAQDVRPELLLRDLQGQLDLLAQRLRRR